MASTHVFRQGGVLGVNLVTNLALVPHSIVVNLHVSPHVRRFPIAVIALGAVQYLAIMLQCYVFLESMGVFKLDITLLAMN